LPVSRNALEHLRAADPVLRALIDELGPDQRDPRRGVAREDHYGALVRSIIGQQLSTTGAR
jgi:3-methyladenine DNA glycosylase/8-oxoguanine DNA glycosylase